MWGTHGIRGYRAYDEPVSSSDEASAEAMNAVDDGGGEFGRALEALAAAAELATAHIEKAANHEAAYRRASQVVEVLQEATASAAGLRVAVVRRIQDAGGLSLAQLGEVIGVSKARAADMVNAAKKKDAR
jgi:hypothetical protein